MSHASTLRRLGAALLATALAGFAFLAAPPAQAQVSQVCVSWTSSGHSYIDRDGNDWYVVEARCSMWMSVGSDDDADKDHDGTKGANPSGDAKEEHCAFLKGELEEQRTALAWAQGGIQAANDELDLQTYKSGADHAAYVSAHEAYLRAVEALEDATQHYQEETDTEAEHETRNGNTIVVRLAIDPNRPWGEVVIAAQEQLERARAAERAAWDKWSTNSGPAAQTAQQQVDAMNQVLATAPTNIEGLLRDIKEDC